MMKMELKDGYNPGLSIHQTNLSDDFLCRNTLKMWQDGEFITFDYVIDEYGRFRFITHIQSKYMENFLKELRTK